LTVAVTTFVFKTVYISREKGS